MTHSIPDLLSRDGVCARNFRESFAKVAVSSCERKKGKLRLHETKVSCRSQAVSHLDPETKDDNLKFRYKIHYITGTSI